MTQQEKEEMLEYFNKDNEKTEEYLKGLIDIDDFKKELWLNMSEDEFLENYLKTYLDKLIEYSGFFGENYYRYLRNYIPVLVKYYKKYWFQQLNENIFQGTLQITAIKRDNNGKLDFKETLINNDLKNYASPILRNIIGLVDDEAINTINLLVNVLDMKKIEQGLNRLLDKQDDPDITYIETMEYNNHLCIIYLC